MSKMKSLDQQQKRLSLVPKLCLCNWLRYHLFISTCLYIHFRDFKSPSRRDGLAERNNWKNTKESLSFQCAIFKLKSSLLFLPYTDTVHYFHNDTYSKQFMTLDCQVPNSSSLVLKTSCKDATQNFWLFVFIFCLQVVVPIAFCIWDALLAQEYESS